MQSAIVSTAKETDAITIAEISLEAAAEGFVREFEPDEIIKVISDSNYYVVVGKVDDQVVGYAISIYSWGKLHVLDVAVRKERRGLGIGKAMVKHLISHALEKGLSEVYCEVKARNVPALNLFTTLGLRFRLYSTMTGEGFYGLCLPLRRC